MLLQLLAQVLILSGACILIGTLIIPVRQLLAQLQEGAMRRRWNILMALIGIFVVGYLGYAIRLWYAPPSIHEMIVPAIFFLGAGFVWLTARLSLQTVTDVLRVTVLEYENITDPLMGIYNRRHLDCRITEEVDRASRYAQPLAVLLIDVDHFKHINDEYGHQTGDIVLRELGELILHTVRQSDVVARYGGEEILIIAPNTTIPLAGALAERLRKNVETHTMEVADDNQQPAIYITVSIGVAGLSENIDDSEKLIHNADEALYQAKQEGRNRVVVN